MGVAPTALIAGHGPNRRPIQGVNYSLTTRIGEPGAGARGTRLEVDRPVGHGFGLEPRRPRYDPFLRAGERRGSSQASAGAGPARVMRS